MAWDQVPGEGFIGGHSLAVILGEWQRLRHRGRRNVQGGPAGAAAHCLYVHSGSGEICDLGSP